MEGGSIEGGSRVEEINPRRLEHLAQETWSTS